MNNKLLLTFQLFGLGLLTNAIFVIIRMILSNYQLIDVGKSHPTAQAIRDSNSIGYLLVIFSTTVLLIPMIEEFAFRFLLKAKKTKVYFGISALITYLFLIFTQVHKYTSINTLLAFFLLFLILCAAFGAMFWMIFKNSKLQFSAIQVNHPALLLFITSLLFGIAHINVIGEQNHLAGYIPFILPHIITGYIYAYARLSMGFSYGVLCHSLNNFLMYLGNLL